MKTAQKTQVAQTRTKSSNYAQNAHRADSCMNMIGCSETEAGHAWIYRGNIKGCLSHLEFCSSSSRHLQDFHTLHNQTLQTPSTNTNTNQKSIIMKGDCGCSGSSTCKSTPPFCVPFSWRQDPSFIPLSRCSHRAESRSQMKKRIY
ncbi:hypothetical protein VTL71DRAFT_7841 [Oculimacula yallundae]|uniref:Uncharacterized protein n=1 Tax=Oculimacula yallundae TaxID=86028 RepID=A0ABR4CXG6_9HELO